SEQRAVPSLVTISITGPSRHLLRCGAQRTLWYSMLQHAPFSAPNLVGITEGFECPSRPLTMSRAALAAMMSILVLAAGCGMRGRQAAAPAVNQPRPHSTATLQILEPLPGSVITNTKLRVRLALNGGRIIQ